MINMGLKRSSPMRKKKEFRKRKTIEEIDAEEHDIEGSYWGYKKYDR